MPRYLVGSNGRLALAVDVTLAEDFETIIAEALRIYKMLQRIQPSVRMHQVAWCVIRRPRIP